MLAVGLSLASSLSFGVADFLGGLSARRAALLTVMVASQVTGLVVLVVFVASIGGPLPGGELVLRSLLASLFGVGGLAALYRGLAVGSMGVVAPLAATAAVIPVVVGAARGESPSLVQYAGIALALGGVLLAARSPASTSARRRFAAGTGLGVLAAGFIGCFLVAFDAAATHDPYWAALVVRSGSVAVLALATLARRPPLRVAPGILAVVAAAGVLDVLGNTVFAVASTKGLVGVVAVLSSLYPIVTAALARTVLGERIARSQAAGVVAALSGVTVLSLA